MKTIKYTLMRERNEGTEDAPVIVQTFHDCVITCADEFFDANYAIAQRESYDGNITVEDDGQEEPVDPTERIAALEAAMTAIEEGIASV